MKLRVTEINAIVDKIYNKLIEKKNQILNDSKTVKAFEKEFKSVLNIEKEIEKYQEKIKELEKVHINVVGARFSKRRIYDYYMLKYELRKQFDEEILAKNNFNAPSVQNIHNEVVIKALDDSDNLMDSLYETFGLK